MHGWFGTHNSEVIQSRSSISTGNARVFAQAGASTLDPQQLVRDPLPDTQSTPGSPDVICVPKCMPFKTAGSPDQHTLRRCI